MSPLGLTRRQAELLAFLEAEARDGRPSPSFAEMAAHLGLTGKAGIHRLITDLERRGHVVRRPGSARSVAVRRADAEPDLRVPPPVAERLRSYCARRRVAARDVLAEAVAAYIAGHP